MNRRGEYIIYEQLSSSSREYIAGRQVQLFKFVADGGLVVGAVVVVVAVQLDAAGESVGRLEV